MFVVVLTGVCLIMYTFMYYSYNEGIILFIDNYYKPKLHIIN